MNTVELENITKTFGKVTAVDNLSLTVPAGSIYGFIGPNGSGKTTTLRMIMNIFYPDKGSIRLFGQDLRGTCCDRIGYLPEERGLYRKMKVKDTLRFYGRLKNARNIAADVDRWLQRLELSQWANKKVETLSKGMSQKVQFIAAVLAKPELLILDEPFAGLDPVNMEVLRTAILQLRAGGTTVIFSTHDMNIAEQMCDFVFMICKGTKVLDGTLTSIQQKYGQDTLRISTEDGPAVLHNLPGVRTVNDFGKLKELHLNPDSDPQKILAEILTRTKVYRFELASPSLHDIFVRIAGSTSPENENA